MRLLPLAIAKDFCIPKACNKKEDWVGFLHFKNRDKHNGMVWMKKKWNLDTIHDDVDLNNRNGLILR